MPLFIEKGLAFTYYQIVIEAFYNLKSKV